MANEMQELEFGIFTLAQIIKEDLGDSDSGGSAENVAGYSHGYVPEFPMRGSDDDPAFITELRKRF